MTDPIFATATNPCGRAISRVTRSLLVPDEVFGDRAQSLMCKLEDGRAVHLFQTHAARSGDAAYFSGWVGFHEGERHVKFEVQPDDSLEQQVTQFHPAVYDPADPASLKELDGLCEGFVVDSDGVAQRVFSHKLTIGGMDYISGTESRWSGHRNDNGFRTDFWLTVNGGSPEIAVEAVVWSDGDFGDGSHAWLTVPLDYVTISWGEEVRTPYEEAFGLAVGPGGRSLTWTNRKRAVTRCTRPIVLVGSLLCRQEGRKDHEEYLTKCRAGVSRAMLTPDSIDGHLPSAVHIPRWWRLALGDLDDALDDNRAYLLDRDIDGWFGNTEYMCRMNPDAPGTDPGFGNIPGTTCMLFADPDGGAGVRLLDRILMDTARDCGLRHRHHLVDGQPWMWQWDCDVATWEDRTDPRFARTHPNMLGGQLPAWTTHGYTTHDSEHRADAAPLVAWLTGSPALLHILESQAQMAYAYVRGTPEMQWTGVSRASGRMSSYIADAAYTLGDREKVRPLLKDLILDVLEDSDGLQAPDAWFTPIDAQSGFIPGEKACVAYSEGLGMQMHHVYEFLKRDEDPAILEAFRSALVLWARSLVRQVQLDPFLELGFGTPYAEKYTTDTEPPAQPAPVNANNTELSACWIASGVMAYLALAVMGRDGDIHDYAKAKQIVDLVRERGLPTANMARWWTLPKE